MGKIRDSGLNPNKGRETCHEASGKRSSSSSSNNEEEEEEEEEQSILIFCCFLFCSFLLIMAFLFFPKQILAQGHDELGYKFFFERHDFY